MCKKKKGATIRPYLREVACHARRTAVAPDNELAAHLDLLAAQLPRIKAIRDALVASGLTGAATLPPELTSTLGVGAN
jgi:hypothetical protein